MTNKAHIHTKQETEINLIKFRNKWELKIYQMNTNPLQDNFSSLFPSCLFSW